MWCMYTAFNLTLKGNLQASLLREEKSSKLYNTIGATECIQQTRPDSPQL